MYDLGTHIIDQTIVLLGSPMAVSVETYTQREGSSIDDAFNIRMDYGKLKVTLKSSLLVREEDPRYIIHGTKGSFVKYGIDVQEDHLKAGLMPRMEGFGVKPKEKWSVLNNEIGGQHFRGHIETEAGNWDLLFQNLHGAKTEGYELYIKPKQVLEQIRVIEMVKGI
ncbi:hypothetical protein GCM10027035_05160 [Emticicia sediminis]